MAHACARGCKVRFAVKYLQAAVSLGGLGLVVWAGAVPAAKSDIDYAAFARLPIFEGGRVKPLDSFARGALLSIRGKQSVPADGRALSTTRRLLDSAFCALELVIIGLGALPPRFWLRTRLEEA